VRGAAGQAARGGGRRGAFFLSTKFPFFCRQKTTRAPRT
jgi:hypothetical protein